MQIGPIELTGNTLVLAPMAGVTDPPYRGICLKTGADLAVGEMVASSDHLRDTAMSERRFAVSESESVPVVQILGSDPAVMARAAEHAQKCGAKIVDINFGCPARLVCGKACGSAIMRDEALAQKIMESVAQAVTVSVTVKMRLGWSDDSVNVMTVAKMAQDAGLSAVTVHGRTRAQRFNGQARYEEIAQVAAALSIPVIANGDINSPAKAQEVLKAAGCAGLMIGRASYGNPWIFARTRAVLNGLADPGDPARSEAGTLVLEHFDAHMQYWLADANCDELGALRGFRKHARWYMQRFARSEDAADEAQMKQMMTLDSADETRSGLEDFFTRGERL